MDSTYDYEILTQAKHRNSFAYIFPWVKDRLDYIAIKPVPEVSQDLNLNQDLTYSERISKLPQYDQCTQEAKQSALNQSDYVRLVLDLAYLNESYGK